jgi:hypothetical protein
VILVSEVFLSPQVSVRAMRFKDRYWAYNAEVEMRALFATRNSLKLQEMRKVFLPIRNIHARTPKLWSRSKPAAVEIHSTFSSRATDKSP